MLDRIPEALLGLFALSTLVWFSQQRISGLLIVPLAVVVLTFVPLISPSQILARVSLAVGFLIGGLLAGFLAFGVLTGPIGGSLAEVEAFNRIALPLIGIYFTAIISLLLKTRILRQIISESTG